MKKSRYILFLWALTLVLSGCHDFSGDVKRFNTQLAAEATKAVLTTERLADALTVSLDSVRTVASQGEGVLFYVFDRKGLVFWSDNWLAAQHVTLTHYDVWDLYRFDNAYAVGRWTRADAHNIFTVIPIKYAYEFENQQLHNTFVPPFRLPREYDLRRSKGPTSLPVELDGRYVFSLYESSVTEEVPQEETRLADSFTYGNVLSVKSAHREQVHYYVLLALGFVGVLVVLGVLGFVRFHGLRDMPLGVRFQYLIVSLLLGIFVFVFYVSTRYVERRSEEAQIADLQHRARFIQKSLQDLYYWDIQLSERNTGGLNVDLRDLCFTYETDIHVYDLAGNLIGSSSPAVFDKGLISRHMATEPFFSDEKTTIRHEHIGDM